MEQKIIPLVPTGSQPTQSNAHALAARRKHPLPPGLAFVFCQAEACVLGKEADAIAPLGRPCEEA